MHVSHLVVFVPGQRLCGEDKPVLLRSSLHDADVVDGQPALPDHLTEAHTRQNNYITGKKKPFFKKSTPHLPARVCYTLIHIRNSTGKYTLTGSSGATQGHSSRSF